MFKKILQLIAVAFILVIGQGCEDGDDRSYYPQDDPAAGRSVTEGNSTGVQDGFNADTAQITETAVINTSMGRITIGLYGKDAPKTVQNFIGLSKSKYYNGILFHRVAKDFLIQAGDKNTKNKNRKSDWGNGGESFFGGEFEDEINPSSPSYKTGYVPGVVAMANRGPNTNTSQFFICLEDALYLKHKWTIFGRVINGMEIVRKISNVEVEPGPYEDNDGIPKKPVHILSVEIKKTGVQ